MRNASTDISIGVRFAFLALAFAWLFPCELLAQDSNVKARNSNRSIRLKSSIVSGSGNQISETNTYASFIGGGQLNKITGRYNSTIGGGYSNSAIGSYNFVGGGSFNTADDWYSAVLGGSGNYAADAFAAIGGGLANYASDNGQTIAGGRHNFAGAGNCATIGGGESNSVVGRSATIGGGDFNSTSGRWAVIPGGVSNSAARLSFAAGAYAKSTNEGSFVWSGITNVDTVSTNTNSFTVRAPGGVRFITTIATNGLDKSASYAFGAPGFDACTNGVVLLPGANSWAALSDSNAKTAIRPIDSRAILRKLAKLPVTQWQYKGQPERDYIGPMAQDFHAAFGLGYDEKTIATADTDGVIYAAIQGLVEELKVRDKRIEELESKSAEVETLRTKIENLEERLNSLPPSP